MVRKKWFQDAVREAKAQENLAGHDMGNVVNQSPAAEYLWSVRSRCRRCGRTINVAWSREGNHAVIGRSGGYAWGCIAYPPHAPRDAAMHRLRAEADGAGHAMGRPGPESAGGTSVRVVSRCAKCQFTVRVYGHEDGRTITVMRAEVGPIPRCPDARLSPRGLPLDEPPAPPPEPAVARRLDL